MYHYSTSYSKLYYLYVYFLYKTKVLIIVYSFSLCEVGVSVGPMSFDL